MALTLTVPDEGATSASDVETHPARLEEQLAQLPLLNAPDSRRSVYKLLSSLNRSEIDDERRLTLLELYRVPVDKICRELQRIAGEKPFHLDCRTAGKVLGVHHVTAWRGLRRLVESGRLRCVRRGDRLKGFASEFVVLWNNDE